MMAGSTDVRNKVSTLSDRDLLKMIGINAPDYEEETIYCATEELARRGVPIPSGGPVAEIESPRPSHSSAPSPRIVHLDKDPPRIFRSRYNRVEGGIVYHQTEDGTRYDHIQGVGGSLLFLCLSFTVFNPLLRLVFLALEINEAQVQVTQLGGVSKAAYLMAFFAAELIPTVLIAFSIYAGVALWKVKHGAVQVAKTFLWTHLAFAILLGALSILGGLLPGNGKQTPVSTATGMDPVSLGVLTIVHNVGYFTIWYYYLTHSNRVIATYQSEG
jgi:hypothetical protein